MSIKRSSDARRQFQSGKGMEGAYRYYSSMLRNLNGMDRQEGSGSNSLYYESITLMKFGKLTGCRC